MSILKALRWIVWAAILVVAFAFVLLNGDARVGLVRFPLIPDREGMRLVELMLYPLAFGLLVGISLGLLKVLELQARLRGERRGRHRVQGELTALRNLPLEDVDEVEEKREVVP